MLPQWPGLVLGHDQAGVSISTRIGMPRQKPNRLESQGFADRDLMRQATRCRAGRGASSRSYRNPEPRHDKARLVRGGPDIQPEPKEDRT